MCSIHSYHQLTLINLTLESAAEMWYLCKSWTIKPAKRLNVLRLSAWSTLSGKNAIYLGILVAGLISIRTLLAVLMKTWRKLDDLPLHNRRQLTWRSPALLRGESKSISKDWWVISGRALEKSRPFLGSQNINFNRSDLLELVKNRKITWREDHGARRCWAGRSPCRSCRTRGAPPPTRWSTASPPAWQPEQEAY